MSTQKVRKPEHLSYNDWVITRKKASMIVSNYHAGKPWDTRLFIGSKQFYQLICNQQGEPLISKKAKLAFGQNDNVKTWFSTLKTEASTLVKSNHYYQASKKIELLESMAPNNKEVLILKAFINYKTQKNQVAWSTLCKLIALYPGFDRAYFLRAQLLERIGKEGQALEDLTLCISVSNDKVIPVLSKTRILIKQFKFNQALSMLEKYKADFQKVSDKIKYAQLLQAAGDSNAAVTCLLETVKNNVGNNELHTAIAKIAYIGGATPLVWKHLETAKRLGNQQAKKLWNQLKSNEKLDLAA